ncbi:MAG: iron ABC transporter permease [Acidaminococcaceae bacterium]
MSGNLCQAEAIYSRITKKKIFAIVILLLLFVLLFFSSLTVGTSGIDLKVLLSTLFGQGQNVITNIIILNVRLPIALMAVLVGSALAVGGCAMQTILKNPMASPYTLGIASAAAFGAALGIVLDINIVYVPKTLLITANSFIMALFASTLIYVFASNGAVGKNLIILFGIALNFVFGALTMFLQYIADESKLQSLIFWSFGSLLRASEEKLGFMLIILSICFYFLYKKAWLLTALTFNDQKAISLGVDVYKVRRLVIIMVSLITATAVCFVGTIGFVGLIAPHLARSMVGDDNRFLLPTAALLGAVILSAASILSRLIVPGTVLPIGLITSLIGIPFFMLLIFKNRKGRI